MADRGTAVAYDAQAVEQGVFEHVMEPTAAFGATVVAYDGEQVVVDLEAYGHALWPAVPFGLDFTGLYFGPW